MKAFWNDVVNCVKLEEYTENKHGWCNSAMLESDGQMLAMIKLHRIVDNNTKSANPCKSEHERKCGKIKIANDIKAEMFQELKNETQDAKATDVLLVGDFDEDENTKNVQEFIVEIGLHEVFSEVIEVDDRIDVERLNAEQSSYVVS